MLEGRIAGKKPPGRLRNMMLDWMMDKTNRQEYKEIMEKVQNREEWHHLILGSA